MQNNRKIKKNITEVRIIFIVLLICILFAVSLINYNKPHPKFKLESKVEFSNPLYDMYLASRPIPIDKNKLDKNVIAKSYIIYDITNDKVIVSKNEGTTYPLASITKLMTAYTAISDCYSYTKEYLPELLVASDNESAEKIASLCPDRSSFISKMNYYSKANNLKLNFTNPSGLDTELGDGKLEASNIGDLTSVAKLINLLNKKNKDVLLKTVYSNYSGIINTNTYVKTYPFIIGSKTGYTDVAGGNLVTLYEIGPKKKIAIVVLSSTEQGRFIDTKYLLNAYLDSQ